MRGFLQGCWSRGLKRRPLLQTSSPLNPKINPEDSHWDWYSERGHFKVLFFTHSEWSGVNRHGFPDIGNEQCQVPVSL